MSGLGFDFDFLETQAPSDGCTFNPWAELTIQFVMMGSGLVAEIYEPGSSNLLDVKGRVFDLLHIPIHEQALVFEESVWDDDRILAELHGGSDRVLQITVVHVASARRIAVSGHHTGVLKVWDLDRGYCVRELKGHMGAVTCVAMHMTSQRALSGGADGFMRMWNVGQTNPLFELGGHTGKVICLAVAWSPMQALTGSSDHTIRMWNLEQKRCTAELHGHTESVTCIDIDETRWRAISGSMDCSVRIWDLYSREMLQSCLGHVSPVNCVALDCTAYRALSGGFATIKIWELNAKGDSRNLPVLDGFNIGNLKAHKSSVNCVGFDQEGCRIVTGGGDSALLLWNPGPRRIGAYMRPVVLGHHESAVACLAVDWMNNFLVSGGEDGLWMWDLQMCKPVRALWVHAQCNERVTCVAIGSAR